MLNAASKSGQFVVGRDLRRRQAVHLSCRAPFQKRIAQARIDDWFTLYSPRRAGRRGASRPVVAVDGDIFLGEIAGQNAVTALAEAERDLDLDLRLLHRA